MFLVGTGSFFFLAWRWVGETAVFGSALLFCTQPLLVGHAFMNPKDVVFMSLLIASVTVGLWMVDRGEKSSQVPGKPLQDGVRSFFRQFVCWNVWLAGLLLGFSSAIRMAALHRRGHTRLYSSLAKVVASASIFSLWTDCLLFHDCVLAIFMA